jgi:hypothetical protein
MCLSCPLQMGLSLAPNVWSFLVGQTPTPRHLSAVDPAAAAELQLVSAGTSQAVPSVPSDEELAARGLTFSVTLSDGRKQLLMPGGDSVPVTSATWPLYRSLATAARLHESSATAAALCHGLAAVVPAELLHAFGPRELETMVVGSADVNVEAMKVG